MDHKPALTYISNRRFGTVQDYQDHREQIENLVRAWVQETSAPDQEAGWIMGSLGDRQTLFLAVQVGGQLAGFIRSRGGAGSLAESPDILPQKISITEVYVDPAFRRQGLATALVAEWKTRAREARFTHAEGDIPPQGPGLAFFSRLGFTLVRRVWEARLGECPSQGPEESGIAQARPADLGALEALAQDFDLQCPPEMDFLDDEDFAAGRGLAARTRDESQFFFLAKEGESPQGFLFARVAPRSGPHGTGQPGLEIFQVFVKEESRRRGWAWKLLDHALAQAVKQNLGWVRIFLHPTAQILEPGLGRRGFSPHHFSVRRSFLSHEI